MYLALNAFERCFGQDISILETSAILALAESDHICVLNLTRIGLDVQLGEIVGEKASRGGGPLVLEDVSIRGQHVLTIMLRLGKRLS